jgi:hypothetical protein
MRALGLMLAVASALACVRPASTAEDSFSAARARMVSETIAPRGVKDPRVLAAMRKVPRHEFLPDAVRPHAYDDAPVPIGYGQTASQPYMVAVMTELRSSVRTRVVLEIGTGSGYQAAILAEVAGEVYSIEILEPLAARRAAHARAARVRARARAAGGRLSRLARGGAVRCDRGHGRAARGAEGVARAAGAGGTSRRSRRAATSRSSRCIEGRRMGFGCGDFSP